MENENNNQMNQSQMPESSGSKKGIVWLIVLVIIALIVVALTTGKKDDAMNGDVTNEGDVFIEIDENASDDIEDIEADLEFETAEDELLLLDGELETL